MKLYKLFIACALSICVSSCDDFLDVNPEGEKLEKELFKNAQGFEDAIYGVYGSLQQANLYGKDMLWGVTEVLAQNLDWSSYEGKDLSLYRYEESDDIRQRFAMMWNKSYETLGWTNNILNQLQNWNEQSLPFYNYYKGEMLGIRAMLHFDLLRLFAPTDESKQGIPYVKDYSFQVKPFYKVGEVYKMIIDDLLEAEKLLAPEESKLSYPRTDNAYHNFEKFRYTHFNIYAVRALLARVYWTKGDMALAAKYAQNVIDSKCFPLVNPEEIEGYLAGTLSPKETIFGVYSTSYHEMARDFLYEYISYRSYTAYEKTVKNIYQMDVPENNQDFRFQTHFKGEQGGIYKCLKLVDRYTLENNVSENRKSLHTGVTLMHVSELYLIAAEALLESNPVKALEYFDEEIASRGLTKLSDRQMTLTKEMIYNEYRKEMFCEGQIWFNMKRLHKNIVNSNNGNTIPASDKVYVLPIPEEEFEFRNENN